MKCTKIYIMNIVTLRVFINLDKNREEIDRINKTWDLSKKAKWINKRNDKKNWWVNRITQINSRVLNDT
jgi:hypothetical protein